MDPRHPLHPRVVRPVRRDPTGKTGPTKGQAAGPHWRWSSHGLYVPSSVDDGDVDQRIYEAAVLLPEYGGVTGWAGLRWGGATWFDGMRTKTARRPVPLALMHNEIRSQPGVLVTSERLPPKDLTTHDGISITTHVRSVCFEMRYAPSDRDAVVVLDMAARHDLVSIDEVAAYVATLNGWTGVPRCRRVLPFADENSWSGRECFMRWYWMVDCGFPRPRCNQPVFDLEGRHIGTPDLLDVEAGVAGEYDSALHLEGKRRGKDLQREAAFRRVGLEYFTMVAADEQDPESTIIRRMIETRARARWEPEATRRWTVVPPPWWTSTTTVAARRRLSSGQRRRLLGYLAG